MLFELKKGPAVKSLAFKELVEKVLSDETNVRALSQETTIECRKLSMFTTERDLRLKLETENILGKVPMKIRLKSRTLAILIPFVIIADGVKSWILVGRKPVDIAGDFNVWAVEWGSRCTNVRGNSLLEALAKLEVRLSNEGAISTFRRDDREFMIDVTFCSPSLLANMNWRVCEQYTHSDHQAILYTIGKRNLATGRRNRANDRKWKTKAFDKDVFIEELHADSDSLDLNADQLTETARRRVQRERDDAAREVRREAFRVARAALKKAIRQSKTNCLKELCRDADVNPWGNTYRVVIAKVSGPTVPAEMCPEKQKVIVAGLFTKHDSTSWPFSPYAEDTERSQSATKMLISQALLLSIIACYIVLSNQASTPLDDHYWAGVVEFSTKDKYTEEPDINTAKNLAKYIELINSTDADPLDIIVFPEHGLDSIGTASFVPSPEERVAPCNNLLYETTVRDLSCVARLRQKYLVINLLEKALCPQNDDTRPCAKDGLYRFNTNVVFDRNGFVIARYRKYNLFGEAGINTTVYAEAVKFETDFGVTFGTFTCFDLLFDQPAISLIRDGVTDIAFPTMWFSELPFLTAVQIQQAWAYKNNVNFLASGASYPEIGSTGSGVFAGKRGRVVSVMKHHADVKLYVAKVPKIDRPEATLERQPPEKYTPLDMNNLGLLRDEIQNYNTTSLPMSSNSSFQTTLCQKRICCDFALDYTVSSFFFSEQHYYNYRLVARDGIRTFSGLADAAVLACAIVACTNASIDSCGTRFNDPSAVVNAVRFNSIRIDGVIPGDEDFLLFPNSLDMSILPLEVEETQFSERMYTENSTTYREIQHKLVNPRSDLHTFAIWGRDYTRWASSAKRLLHSTGLVLIAVLSCISFK
ncbi:vanin-like protein 1 [Sabethes cyaneus]|uniref:vanin-like protein 1 n=1 Tax=Sabethes cyaneus TaxID=53552 RepID=UPI00237D613E|nr:vanin-like protein 1 [Sabethes cyaneus]